MPYQNVGTPRFYINISEWMNSNSAIYVDNESKNEIDPVYRTLPVGTKWGDAYSNPFTPPDFSHYSDIFSNISNHYIAFLGHDSTEIYIDTWAGNIINFAAWVDWEGMGQGEGANSNIDHKGFSIAGITGPPESITISDTVGSIVIGTFYDMPHSPDLELTMSRETDGIKSTRLKSGTDLIDYKYMGAPMWGQNNDYAPWSLAVGSTQGWRERLAARGRRTWDLSFSYLSDSDIFPHTSSMYNFDHTLSDGSIYETGDDLADNTILTSDTFYSKVIHMTNGGQLPFIFQPDNDDFQPDNFAICKFDMNVFEFEQVANNVYDIKLKIREVW